MQFPKKKGQKKTSMSEPPAVRPENGTKNIHPEGPLSWSGSPALSGPYFTKARDDHGEPTRHIVEI